MSDVTQIIIAVIAAGGAIVTAWIAFKKDKAIAIAKAEVEATAHPSKPAVETVERPHGDPVLMILIERVKELEARDTEDDKREMYFWQYIWDLQHALSAAGLPIPKPPAILIVREHTDEPRQPAP